LNIVNAKKQDTISIMNMISECIKSMENAGIFLWNNDYPNTRVIENDIRNGFSFVIKEKNQCIAYVAINEDQPAEYNQMTLPGAKLGRHFCRQVSSFS